MNKITSSKWQRSGSSIIWDAETLTPLIQKGIAVSLREALTWVDNWPSSFPGNSKTVLINGLQPVMDLLDKDEAFNFLREKILKFLRQAKSKDIGVVFAMNASEKNFEVSDLDNQVYYLGDEKIPITFGLWNGAAKDTNAVFQLCREDGNKKEVTCGYHCVRIS